MVRRARFWERLGINGESLWEARNEQKWKANFLVFADDTALAADCEEWLQEYLAIYARTES